MRSIRRRASLVESTIGKWIIALALLLVLMLIIAAARGRLNSLWDNIKNILRFR